MYMQRNLLALPKTLHLPPGIERHPEQLKFSHISHFLLSAFPFLPWGKGVGGCGVGVGGSDSSMNSLILVNGKRKNEVIRRGNKT